MNKQRTGVLVCLSVLLTQIIVFSNAPGKDKDQDERLPVDISIQRLETGNLVLAIANPSSKEYRLVSNLAQVLDCVFLEFPTRGALQFRNAAGKQISLRMQSDDGWLYPVFYCSSLDTEKNKKLGEMSVITIPGNNALRYPIKYESIVPLALSGRLGETNEPVKELRLRLLMDVATESNKKAQVAITSEWFPVNSPSSPVSLSSTVQGQGEYEGEWCLDQDLRAQLKLGNGVMLLSVTNIGTKERSIEGLLFTKDYLLGALEVQFWKNLKHGESLDTFNLSADGLPGMGSRIFRMEKKVIAPKERIEIEINLIDAMGKVQNKRFASYFGQDSITYRLKLPIPLNFIEPKREGVIQFISPWRTYNKPH